MSRQPDVPEPRQPPPIWVYNVSCYHPNLYDHMEYLVDNPVEPSELIRACLLLLMSLFIIVINIFFLLVINTPCFKKYCCIANMLYYS